MHQDKDKANATNFQGFSSWTQFLVSLILGCHLAYLAWRGDIFLEDPVWADFWAPSCELLSLLYCFHYSVLWDGAYALASISWCVFNSHVLAATSKVGRGAVNQPAANCCILVHKWLVTEHPSLETLSDSELLDSENLRNSLESFGLSIKQNVRVQGFVNILQIVMENS